jgi:hypothetical protein
MISDKRLYQENITENLEVSTQIWPGGRTTEMKTNGSWVSNNKQRLWEDRKAFQMSEWQVQSSWSRNEICMWPQETGETSAQGFGEWGIKNGVGYGTSLEVWVSTPTIHQDVLGRFPQMLIIPRAFQGSWHNWIRARFKHWYRRIVP